MRQALAIDLGGTQLRAAIVNEAGELLSRAALTTDVHGGPKAIIPQMLLAAGLVFETGEGSLPCAPSTPSNSPAPACGKR